MAYNNAYYNAPYYPQNSTYYPNNGAMLDTLNQFKGQQYQPPNAMAMAAAPNITDNEMLWVLGEVEATSYPVAPNNTVILWDKNNPTIYIKSANAQGVPSMRILDYKDRSSEPQKSTDNAKNIDISSFVSLDDFNALKSQFEDLSSQLQEMKSNTQKLQSKKGKEDK